MSVVVNRKRKADEEDLEKLTKEELIERVRKLTIHNAELKNALRKQAGQSPEVVPKKKGREFDFTKCHQRKVLLRFYYLGWDYHGFASQDTSTETIEHHLFAALKKTCLIKDRESSEYHRCGRTDKGVSAFSQVISINIRSKFPPEEQFLDSSIKDELKYCNMLNGILPENIRMIAWIPLKNPKFSARFDCELRTYRYFFPRGKLDIESMQEAAQALIGTHDFRNLCKMDVANGVVTFIRSIVDADIHFCSNDEIYWNNRGQDGQISDWSLGENVVETPWDMFYLEIRGKAFLWHQIRCIMAILFMVGEGNEDDLVIYRLLNVVDNPQKPQYSLAKDVPLNLYSVDYRDHSEEADSEVIKEDLKWIYDKENTERVVSLLQKEWGIYSAKATMIKAMATDLQEIRIGGVPVAFGIADQQHTGLTEGVKTKTHIPLENRDKCSSLEDRIEHYVKKKRLLPEVEDEQK